MLLNVPTCLSVKFSLIYLPLKKYKLETFFSVHAEQVVTFETKIKSLVFYLS